jgi:hypothetical protein
VSSKAIIAMLSKTRPIARMVLLPVRLFLVAAPPAGLRVRPRALSGMGSLGTSRDTGPLG